MRLQSLFDRVSASRSRTQTDHAEPSLDEVDRLVSQGQLVEALDLLVAVNRRGRDPELEVRLIHLRHEAAGSLPPGAGRSPWPPRHDDPFPGVIGRLPEVEGPALDGQVLGGAVAHHGGLVVRGLLNPSQVGGIIEAIDLTAARSDRHRRDGDDALSEWYRPFEPLGGEQRGLRGMVARQGGTWLADSPASTARVLDDLVSAGVVEAVAQHLGERPLFTLQKSTLRLSQPVYKFTSWHQDGSFLGPEVRAMNVWVALTRCGGDHPSPGIELVPARVEDLLPRDGGLGTASISNETVDRAAGDTPVIRPEFNPGDAMLFDERFVHRTYLAPDMTEPRYALECWFFAPSNHPTHYVPFLV